MTTLNEPFSNQIPDGEVFGTSEDVADLFQISVEEVNTAIGRLLAEPGALRYPYFEPQSRVMPPGGPGDFLISRAGFEILAGYRLLELEILKGSRAADFDPIDEALDALDEDLEQESGMRKVVH
jgi:hypothetical protein